MTGRQGWQVVAAVATSEARSALRDHHVLIYSLILPAFLYPLLFWGMSQFSLLQRGISERSASRVALAGAPLPEVLARQLAENEDLRLLEPIERPAVGTAVDAVLEVAPAAAAAGGASFRVLTDQALDRSALARERLLKALDEARQAALLEFAADHGLPASLLRPFEVEEVNVASAEEMGSFILGRMLPLMIMVMAAMGAFYPAIETVVAERERGTLETLLVSAAPRWQIVAGKFLVVVGSGMAAVSLNLGMLALTARQTILAGEAFTGTRFHIPLRALPLVAACSLLVCVLFGAVLMILAVFARTFKEGQSYVTPFYVLCFQPAIVAVFPGIKLTTGLALVPVANAAIMFREAMEGIYRWPQIGLTIFSLAALAAAALGLAARLLKREDILLSPEPGRPLAGIWRALQGR